MNTRVRYIPRCELKIRLMKKALNPAHSIIRNIEEVNNRQKIHISLMSPSRIIQFMYMLTFIDVCVCSFIIKQPSFFTKSKRDVIFIFF